jgi:hypothetical protein
MTSQRRMRFLKRRERERLDRIARAEALVRETVRLGAPRWAIARARVCLAQAQGPLPDVRCEARAKGTGRRCRNMAEPDHWVCKFHGGRSTGAKTAKGKARSLAAVREGHRRWREGATMICSGKRARVG